MQVKDVRPVSVPETATLAVQQINLLDCVNVIDIDIKYIAL